MNRPPNEPNGYPTPTDQEQSLVQLIYVSMAQHEFDDDVLDAILASSVRHNTHQQITGMLIYAEGNFLQVLEGPPVAVDDTMARIAADPRHCDLMVLGRLQVVQRDFEQWSMGFRRLTRRELMTHPAYASLVAGRIDFSMLGVRPGLAMDMLKEFSYSSLKRRLSV